MRVVIILVVVVVVVVVFVVVNIFVVVVVAVFNLFDVDILTRLMSNCENCCQWKS